VTRMVTEIIITKIESPTFEGVSFGSVGQYERIEGILKCEVNPRHPLNAGIINVGKAPRNDRGFVEYDVDLFILKPIDMKKGNGRILYEVSNRGNKLALRFINNSIVGNDPRTTKDAGNGFLMRQGYTIVWTGWQASYPIATAPPMSVATGSRFPVGDGRMLARFPIARSADGKPILGLSREEFIDDSNSNPFIGYLTYPATNLDLAKATLTVREKERDPRQTPIGMSWRYLDEWRIEITRPSNSAFDAGAIYEFIYPVKDPIVYGLAFASMRDVVSFLRYEVTDGKGNPNPLASEGVPGIKKIIAFGASQSGRVLQDLIYQGFNQDEKGRVVFDGANVHIGGSRRSWVNFEFALPGPTSTQHTTHFQVNDQFPFTFTTLYDPISGRTDGFLEKCQAAKTCPKIMHTDTDTELWEGRASLLYTDTLGNDITLPDNVRVYLFASCYHVPGGPIDKGFCQQLNNPLDYRPLTRALLVALDKWITDGTEPPTSRYPKRADGILVPSDQQSTGFPHIPGVNYNGLYNVLHLVNYNVQPPAEGPLYPVFVSKVDSDGNGLAGICLPDVETPVATYTGWNLRTAGHAENELYLGGYYIPFAQTQAERLAKGDPRLSLEERYSNHNDYVEKVTNAVNHLVREHLLLKEDAERIKEAAAQTSIGKPPK